MANIYKDIAQKLTDEEKQAFDTILTQMYEQGFETGFDFSENGMWLLCSESLPQNSSRVDVTVQRRTGARKCVSGRYEDGRWKGAAGKYRVIAWRPACKPYTDEPVEGE